MSLQLKIVEDWKAALKNKDASKDALSLIITELKNRAIKENVSGQTTRVVSDDGAVEVLQKMAKQRREAVDAYRAANRADLMEKEERELKVVESYLPKQLDDEELKEIIRAAILNCGASSMKDMGKVMTAALKEAQGRADGKRVLEMVKELLSEL